jgi:4-carboxymuconolactone decarboxylase
VPRIADIDPARLTPEQKRVHDMVVAGPRGRIAGPLTVWLTSPPLAERAQELGAFCRYHSSLPPRLSELAILTAGAFWRSGYEWYAHSRIGVERGLDPAKLEVMRTGGTPAFEKEDEAAIYAFSNELLRTRRVSQATYERTVNLFGERGAVDLVGILGYYSLICLTINAFEVKPPAPEPDPMPSA